eukprot:257971-Karenia_brevis.AAC.1
MQEFEALLEDSKAYMRILSCASATPGDVREGIVKKFDQPSVQPTARHVFGCKMLNPTDAVGPSGVGGCDRPSLQPTAHHACIAKQAGDT